MECAVASVVCGGESRTAAAVTSGDEKNQKPKTKKNDAR